MGVDVTVGWQLASPLPARPVFWLLITGLPPKTPFQLRWRIPWHPTTGFGHKVYPQIRSLSAGIRLAVAWGYIAQSATVELLASVHRLGGRLYGLMRK